MDHQSIKQLQQGLQAKEYSRVELVQHFLQKIQRLNPTLNSFINIHQAHAIAEAKKFDNQAQQPYAGIPIAHKDIFCTRGLPTTCGSRMLSNFIAPYESTVSQRLKAAGFISLGKTNMDEFAMGSSNETSFFGACKNPWDSTRVPGGSSGGSAASVAANMVVAATGSDTGGSIRQPASFCGISGLKPTYGRVSRFGMIAYASSLDQAGPMANSAEDLAIMLGIMAGHDPLDSTSSKEPVQDYLAKLQQPLQGKTIGVPKQFFNNNLDQSVNASISQMLDVLTSCGMNMIEIDLPNLDLATPCYYILAASECSANLARFDGLRFGYSHPGKYNINEQYMQTRSYGFGKEVKRRILLGAHALSSGYHTELYAKAQNIRQVIRQDFQKALEQVDTIIAPTTPGTAFSIGAKSDPLSMYLNDIYTVAVNLAGLPAIALPIGLINQLPIGAQLIGKAFDEANLLAIGHQYQQKTQWHLQRPDLEASL